MGISATFESGEFGLLLMLAVNIPCSLAFCSAPIT